MTKLPEDLAGRILDGSPDAVLVCDPMGTLRYWNRGAERMFGLARDEALGRSLEVIIPERLRARHWAGWDAVMRTGTTTYGDGRLLRVPALHKDGRQMSIEFSIQLLNDSTGQVAWIVAVIRDVTEQFAREKAKRAGTVA